MKFYIYNDKESIDTIQELNEIEDIIALFTKYPNNLGYRLDKNPFFNKTTEEIQKILNVPENVYKPQALCEEISKCQYSIEIV